MATPVTSLSFSENGYWLALAQHGQNTAEIWDLRKMESIKSLDVGSRVDHVTWDYTGQFLAASGSGGISVQHYIKASKSWTEPLRTGLPSVATAWGPKAQILVTVNKLGVVTVLGA